MPAFSSSHIARNLAVRIRGCLPSSPGQALRLLPQVSYDETRYQLAASIAQSWARQDINAAWNAVARSSLSATEKQIMFNELWG